MDPSPAANIDPVTAFFSLPHNCNINEMMSSICHTHLLTPSLVSFSDTVPAGVCYNSNQSNDVMWSCTVLDNDTNNVSISLIISIYTMYCIILIL